MIPPKYRALMHAVMAATAITAPRYSQLGHAQEALILLLSLALGELIGMAVQGTFLRSFAVSIASAQADKAVGKADKQRLVNRLMQIDAEKERLTFELLIEQKRGAAASRSRASRSGSSYGSYGGSSYSS